MTSKVYTISLNPAIDYVLEFDELVKNKTNRPKNTDMYAAGKGIHVSMLLNETKISNEAVVFFDGHFADFFTNDLKTNKIEFKQFKNDGEIRVNLKLIDHQQTECSVAGPQHNDLEFEKMLSYLEKNLTKNDWVVASGSLTRSAPSDVYQKIGNIVSKVGAKFVVDAFGEPLLKAVTTKPFVIKPNAEELELTFGKKINSEEELIQVAKKLQDMGAENVLVSQGENGALLITKDKVFTCPIFSWSEKLVNAAGAGDSMLAGFISKYIESNNLEESLKYSIICGSASAYSPRIANKTLIDKLEKDAKNLKPKEIN